MNSIDRSPFFSVVIPLYNKQDYIAKTIKSVINQTFQDFEIIIVDDGSTDNSFEIIKRINDSRIKIYRQKNQGLSTTRNNGIKKAKGSYIAMIDADDFWYEHHLEQLSTLIKLYPNMGIYASGYTLQKSDTIFHRARFNGLAENFKGIVPDFFTNSLKSCVAWVGSICIPKSVFNDIGLFDCEIYSEQDTDLYIRIALKYDVALDNSKVSAIYNRTMDDNMSNFNQKKTIPKLLNSYKEIEKTNPSLKKFIDSNRFATLVFFKLSSNTQLIKKLHEDINHKNLSIFQRLILVLPNKIVQILFNLKSKYKLNPAFVFNQKKSFN